MGTIEKKEDFLKYSKKLFELTKSTRAQPYFYVTWALQKVPQYQKTKTYKQTSKENNCGLIMVGKAWGLAQTLRPNIPLFLYNGSHPSNLGAFLTACVITNALTNELTNKLPNNYNITDSNGEEVNLIRENYLDIVFCQKVASKFK